MDQARISYSIASKFFDPDAPSRDRIASKMPPAEQTLGALAHSIPSDSGLLLHRTPTGCKEFTMVVQQGKQSNQKRTLEVLALESKVSVDEVARLYEDERAQLEAGALITSFLPIFAIRNVRETLRRRSSGTQS